jgi:hypothetical protein
MVIQMQRKSARQFGPKRSGEPEFKKSPKMVKWVTRKWRRRGSEVQQRAILP